MRSLFLFLLLAAGTRAADLKVGIIGLDTSHVIAFTDLLNNTSNPHHVPGVHVVAAYRGGSPDVDASRTRIDKFTEQLTTKYGVKLLPDIASLAAQVDAVLLESNDGRKHLEQVKPVFAAKKPVFIDKPLASTYADAKEIVRLGKQSGAPWFSSSSRRFAASTKSVMGPGILGVFVWGPAPLEPHHQMELSWYGIHDVEGLYTLMGTGCETVSNMSTPDADLVVGRWKDGRIGTVRCGRGPGSNKSGSIVFRADGSRPAPPEDESAYAALLIEVVKFFQTGVPPVSPEETLEIHAFMDAAQRSKDAGGAPMKLLH